MYKRNLLFATVLLGVALFAGACAAGRKASKSDTSHVLRVMTYNVHHCNPPSKVKTGEIETDTIAAVIRRQQPDVVALQEIDDHTGRSGNFNEARVLARALGMYYYFAKAIDYDGGGYGVAILSRFPLKDVQTTPLPFDADPHTEHRVLATATITLPDGFRFVFGCTHLDVKSAANCVLQVQQIIDRATAQPLPFIVAGDFNATPESEAIRLLDNSFTRTCVNCAYTIPVEQPSKTIDHIAFRPGADFKVQSTRVIPETYASDHLPVVSEIVYSE